MKQYFSLLALACGAAACGQRGSMMLCEPAVCGVYIEASGIAPCYYDATTDTWQLPEDFRGCEFADPCYYNILYESLEIAEEQVCVGETFIPEVFRSAEAMCSTSRFEQALALPEMGAALSELQNSCPEGHFEPRLNCLYEGVEWTGLECRP